jgi:Flp pilus assembly pilin Flp
VGGCLVISSAVAHFIPYDPFIDIDSMTHSPEQDSSEHENEKKERGASLVEYALLLALIAVIALVAVRAVGTRVSTRFSSIQSAL